MTPIEIARKCIAEISDGWGEQEDEKAAREIEPVIRAELAAEREACAKIAEDARQIVLEYVNGKKVSAGVYIAHHIRARGQ